MDIFEAIARDVLRSASVFAAPNIREPRAPGVSRVERVLPVDSVEISDEARALFEEDELLRGKGPVGESHETENGQTESSDSDDSKESESTGDPTSRLTKEEKEEVEELKDRDQEVRTHEQAHQAAAGPYAHGGPTFDYERGPDNRRYAVGGEVHIDTSKESSDPEANIRKAQVIRRAALSPAEPSVQDRLVASRASRMEAEARQELAEERRDEIKGEESDSEARDIAGSEENETKPSVEAPERHASENTKENENRSAFRVLSSVVNSFIHQDRSGQGALVDLFA